MGDRERERWVAIAVCVCPRHRTTVVVPVVDLPDPPPSEDVLRAAVGGWLRQVGGCPGLAVRAVVVVGAPPLVRTAPPEAWATVVGLVQDTTRPTSPTERPVPPRQAGELTPAGIDQPSLMDPDPGPGPSAEASASAGPVSPAWPGTPAEGRGPGLGGHLIDEAFRLGLTPLPIGNRPGGTVGAGGAAQACPGPVTWRPWGPCCLPHGRAHLLRRAKALNWPRVKLTPLPFVVAGEAAWRKWLLRAMEVDLTVTNRQLSALERQGSARG